MADSLEKEIDLKEKLKDAFGYSKFRGNQEDIIKNVLAGKDSFVIMPTGAGKSLCYQLPAIVVEGTAIVISPLIALMKNQVDQLNAFGINARFLNSTLSKTEINRVKKETLKGEIKLLYVAPESLTKEENIAFLKEANLSFIAIDEAHCISEWGHDFRPEYRKIRTIIGKLGNLPVIALTATATPKVQQDIQRNLTMEDSVIYKSSFNRENLYYEVRPKRNAKKQLVQFVKEHKGESGIIYCLSRKKVEEIANLLKVNDVKAVPYHAGLESNTRMKNQDDFLNENVDVVVATIAFGMGIDKPDVRFVVHYDAPKSLEGYYQETGRAGRDSKPADCLMFFSYNDILKLEKFNKDKPVTERDNARHLLDEITAYAETSQCRRRFLLHYFGESYDGEQCGKTMWCDSCRHPKEQFEAQKDIQLVLRAVQETEERFGIKHIADVLRGGENQYIKSYSHDKLPIYGSGKHHDREKWMSLVRQTLIHEYLEKDIEDYGVLHISEKGKDFIKNPYSVMFTSDQSFADLNEEEEEEVKEQQHSTVGYDKSLYKLLKDLRKKVADKKKVPPYVVFQEASMEEMATIYPTTVEELTRIHGVGQGKAVKFGKPFTELIEKYVEENDIITPSDVVMKSAVNKSKSKILIIQQIDKKIDLEEIAESMNIEYNELLKEIEHICFSGTKLNLNYYIDSILDDDRQDDIYDYFMTAQSDKLSEALDELEEEYTEEEIRLMRIKFLSELAN